MTDMTPGGVVEAATPGSGGAGVRESGEGSKTPVPPRPKLLDLFCGAGGCGVGYHRAGFDVVGVDLNHEALRQYPFPCIHADAMAVLRGEILDLGSFDAIHASPPCQAFSSMRVMGNAKEHADLLTPTRELLREIGLPYVIENVPGSPIEVRPPDLFGHPGAIMLCGSMFNLRTDTYELRRHRWFESSLTLDQPRCRHTGRTVVGFYGDHARTRRRTAKLHSKDKGGDITGTAAKLALVRDLMDIDWMGWKQANQAIPPAYTTRIGEQLMASVGVPA